MLMIISVQTEWPQRGGGREHLGSSVVMGYCGVCDVTSVNRGVEAASMREYE